MFLSACATLPAEYLDLNTKETVGFEAVMERVSDKRVIFIGEVHGTSSIHMLQLEVIRHLSESGKQIAVALEMFPYSKQEILNKWTGGSLNRQAFEALYRRNWSVPFEYYEEIFDYARERHIPLVAINMEDQLVLETLKKGPQAVPESMLKDIKFTDCSDDDEYRKLMENIPHASEFPFFCDGQRLRDSVMAAGIAKAMRGDNRTIVVITGVGHSLRGAVPRMLEKHIKTSYAILLPEETTYFIKTPPDKNIADYIWY